MTSALPLLGVGKSSNPPISTTAIPHPPPPDVDLTFALTPESNPSLVTNDLVTYDPILLTDSTTESFSIPLSDWDGLLAVELSLRQESDCAVIDLSTDSGRSHMSRAVEGMSFLDPHDSHLICSNLDNYTDGPLPNALKLSLEEVGAACRISNSTLLESSDGCSETIISGTSGTVITYDSTEKRYSINIASPPSVNPLPGSLKACFWNCNTWNRLKALKIAELALSSDLDVVCITDTRIDSWRALTAVNSFAFILNEMTSKVWKGLVSPKHGKHNVGRDIIMYSNRVERPSIQHIIPCGVLSELSCRWGGADITILSIYRPVINPESGSLRYQSFPNLGRHFV